MPKPPQQCTHIKVTGERCGSPALRRESFCYFAVRGTKDAQLGIGMQLDPVTLLEDQKVVRYSLMRVVDGRVEGTLDAARAKLILQALRLAARNANQSRLLPRARAV